VQYHWVAGCDNTPYEGKGVRGITMTGCKVISHANPFCKQRQQGRKSFHLNPNSRARGGRVECGPRSKDGSGRKINELSPNRKLREPSDC
jgi:hypothetical protein